MNRFKNETHTIFSPLKKMMFDGALITKRRSRKPTERSKESKAKKEAIIVKTETKTARLSRRRYGRTGPWYTPGSEQKANVCWAVYEAKY